MTYKYIYDININRCKCADSFLKDTIIIIYISTIVISILYMLVYLITAYK
jgi:hypothetical protein